MEVVREGARLRLAGDDVDWACYFQPRSSCSSEAEDPSPPLKNRRVHQSMAEEAKLQAIYIVNIGKIRKENDIQDKACLYKKRERRRGKERCRFLILRKYNLMDARRTIATVGRSLL